MRHRVYSRPAIHTGRLLRSARFFITLAVINRISSGEPQTIQAGTDRALTGLAGRARRRVSDDIFLDESTGLASVRYNRAVLAVPALGTYGNAGFFSVPGIGTWTLDAAVSRSGRCGNRGFEARLEAFNVPKAVRAHHPSGPITNVNFGRGTSVQQPRIMQCALK